jgi:hypothetical protein
MIKTLMVAVWATVVLVGADFGAAFVMKMQAEKASGAKNEEQAFETRKSRELSVPIIRDGAVKGYVVVQVNYVVDLAAAKKLPAPPEPYVIDETFQYIYGDDKIDFAHLDKIDIGKMTESLIQRVNTRLRTNVVTDMGIAEFNFLLNSENQAPKGKT